MVPTTFALSGVFSGRRLEVSDRFLSGVEVLLALGPQERRQHLARWHAAGAFFQDGEVVVGAGGDGEEEQGEYP
jgi:hypothetical protein